MILILDVRLMPMAYLAPWSSTSELVCPPCHTTLHDIFHFFVSRQWFDWMMFLQSVGAEPVSGRRCQLTQCRMLPMSPPVLLPTPLSKNVSVFSCAHVWCFLCEMSLSLAVILLRLSDALEAFLVQDVFQMLHQSFAGRYLDPHILQLQASRAQQVKLPACSGSSSIALPDNSEVMQSHMQSLSSLPPNL